MKIKQAASTIVTAVGRELRKMPGGQIIFVSNTVAIYSKTTSLTAAQLRALNTPLALVPTPGASKLIVVSAVIASYTFVSQPYASPGGAPTIRVRYAGVTTSADAIIESFISGVWTGEILAQTSSKVGSYLPGAGTNTIVGIQSVVTDSPSVLANHGIEVISTTAAGLAAGPILTTTLGSGGTGYAANDTFTIDPSAFISNADATGVVDTVNGSGTVLTYHLTANGTAYPVQNGIDTSTNHTGTGLTINVTSVTPGDGTLKITVNYSIADVS